MTKEEFKGFSSAAQHDMVLEALVRITKNLETMEKESGKPFMGTSKQRRNDIKLLTILAEAFGKNELIWDSTHEVTPDAVEGLRKMVDDEQKIIKAQEKSGKFNKIVVAGVGMERYNSKSMTELLSAIKEDWKKYKENTVVSSGIRKVSDARMAKRRSK